MNFFATNRIVTFAIALGVASIVYMTPKANIEATVPTIDFANIISTEAIGAESNAPEPATMLLFGAGLAGFASVIRKKKK